MPANRRTTVPFDPYHFEREASSGRRYSTADTFRQIYESNHWGAAERSGAGASRDQAAAVLDHLDALVGELQVRTFLDVPCGDFAWMQFLRADVQYVGGDVLPELVAANQRQWAGPSRRFAVIDILQDELPDADLLLCRDCLVHFSLADIATALRNVRASQCEWLLTTTFPHCAVNEEIVTGDWRPINLERAPFGLPAPRRILNEQCTEGDGTFADKSLALWRVSDLP